MEQKLTERAQMLLDNSLEWYVVTLENGEHQLMHETSLSSILQCGEDPDKFGYTNIERCWNGEDLTDENDYV